MVASSANSSGGMGVGLLDLTTFGRRVRAQRRLLGLDSVAELASAVVRKTGVNLTERSLYMIERGDQAPSMEAFLALLITLEPENGLAYFKPAIAEDAWSHLF